MNRPAAAVAWASWLCACSGAQPATGQGAELAASSSTAEVVDVAVPPQREAGSERPSEPAPRKDVEAPKVAIEPTLVSTGIPECDAYFSAVLRIMACVGAQSEELLQGIRDAGTQMADAAMSADPQTRKVIADTCAQGHASIRDSPPPCTPP